MNKALLITFALLFGLHVANAQHELLLTEVQIALAGEKFNKYADKTANLASDLPVTILLFKNNSLSYYACFEMIQRGKRTKLKIRDFVVYNGDEYRGEKIKIKRKTADEVTDRIAGVSEQKIVYNKALDLWINVIYRYEILF